jgi:translation initiation factor IF-1
MTTFLAVRLAHMDKEKLAEVITIQAHVYQMLPTTYLQTVGFRCTAHTHIYGRTQTNLKSLYIVMGDIWTVQASIKI